MDHPKYFVINPVFVNYEYYIHQVKKDMERNFNIAENAQKIRIILKNLKKTKARKIFFDI